jgi:hypothetical protein
MGILNIQMLDLTGNVFNYFTFHYSSLSTFFSALSGEITFGYLLKLTMVCLASFFFTMLILVITDMLVKKFKMKKVLVSSLICSCMVYMIIAPGAIKTYSWEYNKLANPVVVFAGSVRPFFGDPGLSTTMGGLVAWLDTKK